MGLFFYLQTGKFQGLGSSVYSYIFRKIVLSYTLNFLSQDFSDGHCCFHSYYVQRVHLCIRQMYVRKYVRTLCAGNERERKCRKERKRRRRRRKCVRTRMGIDRKERVLNVYERQFFDAKRDRELLLIIF